MDWATTVGVALALVIGLITGLLVARHPRRARASRTGATGSGWDTAGRPGMADDQRGGLSGLGRRTIDSLRAGVVVLDPEDQPVLVNPAARAMGLLRTGNTPGSMAAHPLIRTLAGQVRRTGVRREIELDLPRGRDDVGPDPLGVHLRAMGIGAGHVAVEAVDVTEAHRLARVRRDFVANVSHELKTPIGALQLLAEALLDATEPTATPPSATATPPTATATATPPPATATPPTATEPAAALPTANANTTAPSDTGTESAPAGTPVAGEQAADIAAARRFAERIQHESTRLGRLVQELLELTRLQGAESPPTPEPVAVDWVIAEVLDRTRTTAAARRVTIAVEGERGLTVYGNDNQLATAVSNLVENAIIYSGTDVTVTVTVGSDGDHVTFAVADQGIGIAPADVDRIFERFYRADQARSRSTGGTGLGLAIVKHIASNHGGRVDVSSTLGGGSTFTLRLPARSPEDRADASRSAEVGADPTAPRRV